MNVNFLRPELNVAQSMFEVSSPESQEVIKFVYLLAVALASRTAL